MDNSQIDINAFSEQYKLELSKEHSFESILSNTRKKQVLKSIEKYGHSSILEIGCGINPLFPYIKTYKNYVIVEPIKEFVDFVKELDDYSNNVIIMEGFLEDIYTNLRDFSFDFIFLSGVLHQSPCPNKLLKIIHDLCNSNSVVHINVPNAYSFHRLLALEMGYINTIYDKSKINDKLQTNWVFDRDIFFNLVDESGFRVLDFGTYLIKLFTNDQMEKMITSGILSTDIIHGLENMAKYIPDMGCEMFADLSIRGDDG